MARKVLSASYEEVLEILRSHGFTVTPEEGDNCRVRVGKNGVGAVLRATERGAAFVAAPGPLVHDQVAQLVDRGYQKFFAVGGVEFPATADRLHAVHDFSQQLRRLAGAGSLYNESLGSTSDLYRYDRLRGRETAEAAPPKPWEGNSAH